MTEEIENTALIEATEAPAPTEPPPRMALCIDKPTNATMITIDQILNAPHRLVDRAICDSKPLTEEALSMLQLLPYIALVDTTGPEPKYFFYTRGAAGNEGDLHGMISIGIGGHMEEPPAVANAVSPFDLARMIATGAVREIYEEIEVELPFFDFANALIPGMCMPVPDAQNVLAAPWVRVLYTPVRPVDSVHVAICFAVKMTAEEIGALEEGVITRGQWLTFSEIMALVSAHGAVAELETWTSHYLTILNDSWINSKFEKDTFVYPTEAPTAAEIPTEDQSLPGDGFEQPEDAPVNGEPMHHPV